MFFLIPRGTIDQKEYCLQNQGPKKLIPRGTIRIKEYLEISYIPTCSMWNKQVWHRKRRIFHWTIFLVPCGTKVIVASLSSLMLIVPHGTKPMLLLRKNSYIIIPRGTIMEYEKGGFISKEMFHVETLLRSLNLKW